MIINKLTEKYLAHKLLCKKYKNNIVKGEFN